MKEQEESAFNLFWLPVSDENRYYLVPEYYYGQIPWFIWGKDLEKYRKTNKLRLNEQNLLKGILYGLSPDSNKVGGLYEEDVLLGILDVLQAGFNQESREELILNTAYNVKRKNGVLVSLAIYRTGMYLLPNSSPIKSDYIMSLWEKACIDPEDEDIYKEILSIIPKIDLDEINSSSKECICYYGFCSLFLMNSNTKIEQDIEGYISTYIDGVITIDTIMGKINAMLSDPDRVLTPKELRVHDD